MLVDLARNYLQNFCDPGTVVVRDLMHIQRFSHIQHIVSTVTGHLREGATAYDALRATFPAGTLSGAPKPAAMRIIDRLEPVRRGGYGGTVGYIDFAGDMDMAMAIPNAVSKDGTAHVQAGGGVVRCCGPTMQRRETQSMTAAALRAIASADPLRSLWPAAPGPAPAARPPGGPRCWQAWWPPWCCWRPPARSGPRPPGRTWPAPLRPSR